MPNHKLHIKDPLQNWVRPLVSNRRWMNNKHKKQSVFQMKPTFKARWRQTKMGKIPDKMEEQHKGTDNLT